MDDIRIVNIKDNISYDIYCGRANKSYNVEESKWANPFIIGKDGTREEVIELYRLWINCQPDLLEALPELRGKRLGCWCYVPQQQCHCEVLIKLSESKYISNWFSNMITFEIPLKYQGIEYKAVENFYQAMKLPKDRLDWRAEIAAMSPFKSKSAIRDKKYILRIDYQEDKLAVMEYALRHKFAKETDWYRKLMLTKDWEVVEYNNWRDVFWGKDIKTREGENHLGKLLMKIREENK